MTQTNEMIERFTKMAEADPTNELGHFSLGRALLEAGRSHDAIASLERVIELNPNMSRAHQLLGSALLATGQRAPAIERWTQGVKLARERGEPQPEQEMIAKLKELGAPVPEETGSQRKQEIGAGQILCRRCGKVGPQLKSAPMRSALGQEVFQHICADCWQAAIRQGTKVINELRLPLDDPKAGEVWDQHIREFLQLTA